MKLIDIVLAFLLPPLAVGLRTHSVKKTIIAVVLMLLGHIPGIIYALYVVSRDEYRTVS